jgi:hypothetical protein
LAWGWQACLAAGQSFFSKMTDADKKVMMTIMMLMMSPWVASGVLRFHSFLPFSFY